jgi:hypothetical protein
VLLQHLAQQVTAAHRQEPLLQHSSWHAAHLLHGPAAAAAPATVAAELYSSHVSTPLTPSWRAAAAPCAAGRCVRL